MDEFTDDTVCFIELTECNNSITSITAITTSNMKLLVHLITSQVIIVLLI
jgi:hypothetical protein